MFVLLVRLDREIPCVRGTVVIDEAHGGTEVLAVDVVAVLLREPV